MTNPQRTPATQSRPMEKAAAGGMSARQVGSPAGGRRTAAVFPSVGAAATNSILSRNRQIVNGEVRRLGFAPIPSRRFNSNPGALRGERRVKRPYALAIRALCSAQPDARDAILSALQDGAGVAPGRARNSIHLQAFHHRQAPLGQHHGDVVAGHAQVGQAFRRCALLLIKGGGAKTPARIRKSPQQTFFVAHRISTPANRGANRGVPSVSRQQWHGETICVGQLLSGNRQ